MREEATPAASSARADAAAVRALTPANKLQRGRKPGLVGGDALCDAWFHGRVAAGQTGTNQGRRVSDSPPVGGSQAAAFTPRTRAGSQPCAHPAIRFLRDDGSSDFCSCRRSDSGRVSGFQASGSRKGSTAQSSQSAPAAPALGSELASVVPDGGLQRWGSGEQNVAPQPRESAPERAGKPAPHLRMPSHRCEGCAGRCWRPARRSAWWCGAALGGRRVAGRLDWQMSFHTPAKSDRMEV